MSLGRSVLIFFGALIFSVLLWSYVRLSAPYEADVDLPVRLTSPKGYALSSGLPERLHARVRGAGWQILLMNFTGNSRFQFDLADRSVTDTGRLVLRSDEISHAVMMPSEVRILKVDPDSLQLAFAKRAQKLLRITPQVEVQPARGYTVVGLPIVRPSVVMVEGSPRIIDSLAAFPTKPLVVRNAKDDVEQTLDLSDTLSNEIVISPNNRVTVHVDVQAIGERVFPNVPISVEGIPPNLELLLLPSTVNVTLRGGVDQLAHLSSSALRARVAFDPVVFDTARALTPQIETPAGLQFLSADPEQVHFIVRRKSAQPNAAK